MSRRSLQAVLIVALGLLASGPAVLAARLRAGARAPNEFAHPSSHHVPKPSRYNRTPSCPPTAQNGYDCTLPRSAWPPRDHNNPEIYLNSAYWPAEERPDIEMYAIQRYGYDYKNCSAHLPHYCFLVDAKAAGYPVTHKPKVGDLWLAPENDLIWEDGARVPDANGHDWYLGYVQRVYPDGSFIQSWGGSDTPADSGLAVTWMSATMDAKADFIGFKPAVHH